LYLGEKMSDQNSQTELVVTAGHTPLSFLLYLTKLTIEVDGTAQVGSWGRRSISVASGPHEVKVYYKYLWMARAGEAAISVQAVEGSTVSLSYRAPLIVTFRGKVKTVV
jgi:hypothetical protein